MHGGGSLGHEPGFLVGRKMTIHDTLPLVLYTGICFVSSPSRAAGEQAEFRYIGKVIYIGSTFHALRFCKG